MHDYCIKDSLVSSLTAACLLQNGPTPCFLAPAMIDEIFDGGHNDSGSIEDNAVVQFREGLNCLGLTEVRT